MFVLLLVIALLVTGKTVSAQGQGIASINFVTTNCCVCLVDPEKSACTQQEVADLFYVEAIRSN